VVVLRVESGEPVWERRLNGAPGEILALDDRLYVGTSKQLFYCLKADDGAEDWRWRTGGDVMGAPIVDERNVYVASLDNLLRAFDRTSGNQRWKAPLPLRPTGGAVRVADVLIVTGLSASARAYFLRDGRSAGEVTLGGEMGAPPHVFIDPRIGLPVVVMIGRDIARGAAMTAVTHDTEPAIAPLIPLPSVQTIPPMRGELGPAGERVTPDDGRAVR
jgi:hypothetical protein